MSTTTSSINQLPITDEIVNGDYLILDNDIETRRLDFKDFIIGLGNVTFASTITATTYNVASLSAYDNTNTTNLNALSGQVTSNTLNISSLSSTFYGQTTVAASITAATHYIKLRIGGTNYALMLSATS